MPGLNQMSSTSSAGASVITMTFSLSLAIDIAEQEVQAAINAANLYNIQGVPLGTTSAGEGHIAHQATVAGNGTVPQEELDTVADILAACVDSANTATAASAACVVAGLESLETAVGGADIGAGAYVAPHSVVMKGEHLLPGVRYEGAPTQVHRRGTETQRKTQERLR